MNSEISRSIISAPFVFGAFYAVPFMADYMVKKQRIRLVGWELILFLGPIATIYFLIKHDWEIGIAMLAASLGSHFGLYKLARRPDQPSGRHLK